MFRTLVHLLPRARAWSATVDRMFVRLLKALALPLDSARNAMDLGWLDVFPGSTRLVPSWEKHFALPAADITDAEARARLAGEWAAQGGQSHGYIHDTLSAAGFPVFVHQWWDLAPHGVPQAKDPREYLLPAYGGTDTDGHLLGNIEYETGKAGPFAVANESIMHAGEANALAGYFGAFTSERIVAQYQGPEACHPFYVYIGGETFADTVNIAAARREEFERLVRKILPGQQYAVLRVRYV